MKKALLLQWSAIVWPPLRKPFLCYLLILKTLCCLPFPAKAVFIVLPPAAPAQITMRVGSANSTVNQAIFNINTPGLLTSTTPVAAVPGAGAPPTSPPGGIELSVTARTPVNQGRQVIVMSDSGIFANFLFCQTPAQCGSQSIPITSISWTAANQGTLPIPASPGFFWSTVGNGAFNGGGQSLTSFQTIDNTIQMSVVLFFTYNNAVAYPAGSYLGRVLYTATMP